MNEVERWNLDQDEGEWAIMCEDKEGEYVLASDYDQLKTENGELTMERDAELDQLKEEVAQLKAQVEQLQAELDKAQEPVYQIWCSTDMCGEFWSWEDVEEDKYDEELEPTKKRKLYREVNTKSIDIGIKT